MGETWQRSWQAEPLVPDQRVRRRGLVLQLPPLLPPPPPVAPRPVAADPAAPAPDAPRRRVGKHGRHAAGPVRLLPWPAPRSRGRRRAR